MSRGEFFRAIAGFVAAPLGLLAVDGSAGEPDEVEEERPGGWVLADSDSSGSVTVTGCTYTKGGNTIHVTMMGDVQSSYTA